MHLVKIGNEIFEELAELQKEYNAEIGEPEPTRAELETLKDAIENKKIHFYGCICDGMLIGCCSVCSVFSTYNYADIGMFEDFYIRPRYRHKGIARKLASFAYKESGVGSLIVGCADCDLPMYRAIGFKVSLGNMLAYEE